MNQPKVNGGIHGPLNYNPELIKEIEKVMQELKEKYPIDAMQIYLSSIDNKKWKKYNGEKV